MRALFGRAAALAGTCVLAVLVQCRDPTEITLVIDTDVGCKALQGVTISVGHASDVETKAVGTITHDCSGDGHIGTLVVVPTGSRDEEVAIKVVGGRGQDAESCVAPLYGPGCIVARRVLHYQPHTPLTLPIELRAICAGVACLPDETCVSGVCRSAHVDPSQCADPKGCGEGTLPGVDGGASDASVDVAIDVAVDVASDGAGDASRDASADTAVDTGADASDATVDASCGDTTANPVNCGACGHGCLGGTCVASACQPIVLASSQGGPWGIAVDGTNVYWANRQGGTVLQMPVAGGTQKTLATAQTLPTGIAVDATSVYWSSFSPTGAISKVPIGGGTITTIASAQTTPSWIAVDATNVYWTIQNNNSPVMKAPITGAGPATVIATGQNFPWFIAIDATAVYWSNWNNSAAVSSVGKNGGTVNVLASAQGNPFGVAIYAGNLYWVAYSDATVMRVPVGGGTPVQLASTGAGSKPYGIAVDASGIYWTNSGAGTVMKLPLGGSVPVTLASGQSNPKSIALDAVAVYWVNDMGSEVVRVAK